MYNGEDETDPMERAKTRSGYEVGEAIRAFQVTLAETGPLAVGRCLHYSADVICSGALQVWVRHCMEYAIDHIGSVSPRIFFYLNKRFKELSTLTAGLGTEELYNNYEFQIKVGEVVLILRECPRRTKVALPKVHPSSFDEGWLKDARTVHTDFYVAKKVSLQENDAPCMLIVANEIMRAIEEGATEKALFWMRWLLDSDAAIRKKLGGNGGLSNFARAPPGWPDKQRTFVGFFLANLAAEAYKDLALKGKMRMNEEYQALLDLYRNPSKTLLSPRRRLDLLCLMFQLLCEVPRWKTPTAPPLVRDEVVMRKAISHVEHFFREVLSFEPVKTNILKEAKKAKAIIAVKKLNDKEQKRQALEAHLKRNDNILMDILNK